MQDFREGRLKRAGQLGFCLACDVEITQAPQSNVAIGLNGDGLIEFWSEGKTHFEDVAGAQLVTPAPPLKDWALYFWTATPVGPRLRDLRDSPGLHYLRFSLASEGQHWSGQKDRNCPNASPINDHRDPPEPPRVLYTLRSISFKRRAHTGFHLSLFPFGSTEANCKTSSFFAGVCAGVCLLHPEHSSLGANAEGPRHLGPCREEDDQIDVRPDWRTSNSKNKCTSHTDVDSVTFSAVADPAFVLPREGNRRL